MNQPSMDRQTALGDASPTSAKRFAPLVLGGLAVFVVLLAYGAFTAFRSARNTISSASTTASRFITAMGAHDYSEASDLCAPDVKSKMSPDALKGLEALVEHRYGVYQSTGPYSWMLRNNNGQSYVQLNCGVQYANGAVPITLILINTGTSYQVYNYSCTL